MAADPARRVDRRDWLAAALVGAAALIIYLPALWTWFVSDDFLILTKIEAAGGLRHPLAYFQQGFFQQYYRPLAFLSQALDWTLWGTNASAFHATSVLIHAANTMLVFALGRRFMDRPGAAAAALLFGLHPASHEAVFWIAARFDLMATGFALAAVIWLAQDEAWGLVAGAAAFAAALLSKESAIALPAIAASYDVFVRGRTWLGTAARLLPLGLVVAGYGLLRIASADLAVAGGGRRAAKAVMMIGAMAAVLWLAWRQERSARTPSGTRVGLGAAFAAAAGAAALMAIGVAWPATRQAAGGWLGFAGYAVFNLISPIVTPPPVLLDPASGVSWAFGGLMTLAVILAALLAWRWLVGRPPALFFTALIIAALLPVSSLANLRYLYLASAGTSLLAAYAWRSLESRARARATAALAIVLAVSAGQILYAGRIWRSTTTTIRDGLALIAGDMPPCGTKDVVLLTAPAELYGVFANVDQQAPAATGQCGWASYRALLHIVRAETTVEAAIQPDGSIELRVPRYTGTIETSRDLRTFEPLRPGQSTALLTPIGRLTAEPEGDAEVFRLEPNDAGRRAVLYYDSAGRVRALRPGG